MIIGGAVRGVRRGAVRGGQCFQLLNRYIGENVRFNILDIISYTEEKNLPGAALFIDFRKAFDTIEWNFLTDTLNNLNFGPDIQNWVRSFYNNVTSCVLNNGHASERNQG